MFVFNDFQGLPGHFCFSVFAVISLRSFLAREGASGCAEHAITWVSMAWRRLDFWLSGLFAARSWRYRVAWSRKGAESGDFAGLSVQLFNPSDLPQVPAAPRPRYSVTLLITEPVDE